MHPPECTELMALLNGITHHADVQHPRPRIVHFDKENTMNIVNLTPHSISLADEAGNIVDTFAPSGKVVRMATSQEVVGEAVAGVPLRRTVFGEVSGLPEPQEGVLYLVSSLIAQRVQRADVVSPDTGPTAVRKDGQVVAVRALQAF